MFVIQYAYCLKLFVFLQSHSGVSMIVAEVRPDTYLVPQHLQPSICTLIARFMGPTWGPSGADRTQVGPMLAPWTLLSGLVCWCISGVLNWHCGKVLQTLYEWHVFNRICLLLMMFHILLQMLHCVTVLSMWVNIIVPMYRLWLHSLYGLYGPHHPLSPERPLNLITHFIVDKIVWLSISFAYIDALTIGVFFLSFHITITLAIGKSCLSYIISVKVSIHVVKE